MIRFEAVKNAPIDTIVPKRSTKGSAGYDFYAPCDVLVSANSCTELIFLNIKAMMPSNIYLQMIIRSSLAVKHNIVLETSGVIDADYYGNEDNDGNIGIKLRNNSDKNYFIKKGERIAQGVFLQYYLTDDDNAEGTRNGGYGSTGV